MAKKSNPTYECQSCGFVSSKWIGKCPNCDSWDSFVEISKYEKSSNSTDFNIKAKPITEIDEDDIIRFSSFDEEFDLILGGGIVPSSLTLIGGNPGVGKSTLLLKIAGNLAKSGKKVLYVSAEESAGQIKLRAQRIDSLSPNLYLLPEIKLSIIKETLFDKFEVAIIDSIQTIYSESITSAPGSVSQVREITFELMRIAKDKKIAIFIIGHITKDGSIAGPRVLEHMVDTVLYFEGDSSRELRMLRGFKNRFGSTSEIGIFEMTKNGLISAKNITSKFFNKNPQSGSVLTVIMEGSRALILEVQALVTETSYPNPKRSATGFDSNRLTMLLALLEKKLELPFNQYDVFINIAGGIKISETGADLAIVASIISSFRNRVVAKDTIFLGEVTLSGDIRDVFSLDNRLKEAKSQGISKAIVAKKSTNEESLGMKCYEVLEVSKIIDWM